MKTWNDLSIREKSAMMRTAIRNGITTLPEIKKAYNEFAEGGPEDNNPTPVTTGGAGYVPNTDYSELFTKLSNLYNYAKTYVSNKIKGTGDGTVINLSDKNVDRIKSDTDNVTTILANEFVENNSNTVRRKKDFVNTTDTLLGDRKIPLSKISTFYGIEDGKLKAGPLEIFNDTTTVLPNRAKNVGKIKEYHAAPPLDRNLMIELRNKINEEVDKYNKEHGFKNKWYQFKNYPRRTLASNVGKDKAYLIEDSISVANKDILKDYTGAYVVTENNDTIKGLGFNDTPKILFADENGNAVFAANPYNNTEELNKYLQENPMYPIMVDNGRYSSYMTTLPSVGIYSGIRNPDNMFIIGTTKAFGGSLENKQIDFEEEPETNERDLPEVIIKPSDKDQLSVIKAQQMIPDLESRLHLYEFLDRRMGKTPLLSQNESIDRLYNVYSAAKYPRISSKQNPIVEMYGALAGIPYRFSDSNYANYLPFRANYNILTNTLNLPTTKHSKYKYDISSLIPELAHAYQFYSDDKRIKENNLKSIFSLPGDIKINGKSGYRRPGNVEHSAHYVIEPALWDYIKGKSNNIDFTPYLNQQSYGGPLVQLINRYAMGGPENDLVDRVIQEEGFLAKPTNIGDGKMTLGSGLTASKWHKLYNQKGEWTEEDNQKAVAKELEERRKWAEKDVPNWNNLPQDSQNALLSYKYNFDFNRKNSPKLYKALSEGDYEEAARQINATSKNPKFKKGLMARRQREQEWFLKGLEQVAQEAEAPVEEVVENASVYNPPQSVIDNIIANNGKYMITGTPPLAGTKVPVSGIADGLAMQDRIAKIWQWIKDFDMLNGLIP